MQFELFKKTGSYVDKDKQEKKSLSFYLKINDSYIPIEPVYFHKKDDKGNDLQDFGYSKRKSVLETLAIELPPKEDK